MKKVEITIPESIKMKMAAVVFVFALVMAGLNSCQTALKAKNKQEFALWQYSE